MNDIEAKSGSLSVIRAAMIIREIAFANREGIRLTDLAASLPIGRPSIHRLLKTLVGQRFVRQDLSTRRYFLGHGLVELGLTAAQHINPRDLCSPILRRIANETGDTVSLMLRSGDELVCVDRKYGSFPVKVFILHVGDRRPLGVGSSGLAVLSALSDEEVKRIIREFSSKRRGLPKSNLLADIQRTRKVGYAMNKGEVGDVRALAVAIRNNVGEPLGALAFVGVRSRVSSARLPYLVGLLKQGGRELESIINQDDMLRWNL